MTIEQKLVKQYGTTDCPEFATWMLKDGTMVNGTFEGYQRDVDHICVALFYKQKAGKEACRNPYTYLRKFMDRCNLRICTSDGCFGFHFSGAPMQKQVDRILTLYHEADGFYPESYILHHTRSGETRMNIYQFIDYLKRYTNRNLPEWCYCI